MALRRQVAPARATEGALALVRRHWPVFVVTGAILATLFLGLGEAPLTTPNEGLYAGAAREMLRTGDWVLPHINGVIYFEKPPLLYWVTALSMRLLGDNAFAARLPSALAGALAVGLVYWLGLSLSGVTAGMMSALVLTTSLGYVLMTRQVMFDGLFTATLAFSLAFFLMASRTGRRSYSYLGYAGLAAAVMTKGLAAIVIVLGVFFCAAVLGRSLSRLRPLGSLGAIALFLALAVPWHVAAALSHHDFLWFYFINEHVLRFLGRRVPADFHVAPPYETLLGLMLLALPWSILLPAGVIGALHLRREKPDLRGGLDFILAWLAFPVVIFTLSRSRSLYYAMPAVPAAALLVGLLWQRLRSRRPSRAVRAWTLGPLAFLLVLVIGGWVWAHGMAGHAGSSGDRAWIGVVAGTFLILGLAASLLLAVRRRFTWAFAALCIGTVAMLSSAALLSRRLAPFDTERYLAAEVNRLAPAGAEVAVEGRLEDNSSFYFYVPPRVRPLLMVDGQYGGDLQFGSHDRDVRHLFLSRAQLAALAAHRPLFYLTRRPPLLPVPRSFRPVATEGDQTLWTNVPALAQAR